MMKRSLAFLLFASLTNLLSAQDMPPLPPLPDQGQGATSSSTTAAPPPAPPASGTSTTAAPAASPELPPLPAQGETGATAASAPATASPALPALPASGDQTAPALAAPGTEETTAAPTTEAAPEAAQPVKKAKKLQPWQVSNARPNVIFGGWVHAKGGNDSSRIAWASQEVLNALLFKKYKLISPTEGKGEEGNYDGQPGRQWREFSFRAPKTKTLVKVYLGTVGKRVWLRVGPGEGVPPAAYTLAQAKKIKADDLTTLHLLQKKFGRRLSPHHVTPHWEAPYRYAEATADH
jgi:hypothetical protein